MAEELSGNRRIAKNTLLLYVRSLVMMLIGIYTSRVVLQALGVEDFGLYGVVGTVVAMFTVINGVLSVGTSRFLTFELGAGNFDRLKKIFSASFAMHLGMAVLITVLLETVGVWFLNTHINIPEGREIAANWCYQFSVLTCFLGLTQVPYGAIIVARERFDLYATIGIFEALFKVALPLALVYGSFGDNLIAYGVIIAFWSIGLQCFYRYYCTKHFPEAKLMIVKDKSIYKSMLSYSLWDFLGQFCAQTNGQGVSILYNMFFGVALNAAQNIAGSLQSKVEVFVGNFMTSLNPQITKSYAQGDYHRFFQLIFESGRYSYYLFLFLSLPIYLECDYILSIWLTEVPEFSSLFFRFTIVIALFRTLARPVITGVHATGDVKFLNLSSGLFSVAVNIPGAYVLFSLGFSFWSYLILRAIQQSIASGLEILSLYRKVKFDVVHYLKNVYGSVFFVTIISAILPTFIVIYMDSSWIRLLVTCAVSVLSSGYCILYFGLEQSTRLKVFGFVKGKFSSFVKRS